MYFLHSESHETIDFVWIKLLHFLSYGQVIGLDGEIILSWTTRPYIVFRSELALLHQKAFSEGGLISKTRKTGTSGQNCFKETFPGFDNMIIFLSVLLSKVSWLSEWRKHMEKKSWNYNVNMFSPNILGHFSYNGFWGINHFNHLWKAWLMINHFQKINRLIN